MRSGLRTAPVSATVLFAAALLAGSSAAAEPGGYDVKALFLLNFARLVHWPPEASPGPGEPLVVGVRGDKEAVATVVRTLEGTRVDEHPVTVRPLTSRSQIAGCHVLFVAIDDSDAAAAWARAAASHATLSVGQAAGFAQRGGVINFFVEDERLHFEVNLGAAQRSGLKLSSRLLRLARLVQEAP